MTGVSGLKVFLVEDESLVALMIEDMLERLGCETVASISRVSKALESAAHMEIDLAILDVNVNGETVFPVAELLRSRQLPLIFSTGYGTNGLPNEFRGTPVLGKPFSDEELRRAIELALNC
jgi:CheY-like chemotaxis protein